MENFKFSDHIKLQTNLVVLQEVKQLKAGDITPSGLIIGLEGKSSTPEADVDKGPSGDSLGLRVIAVGPDVTRVKEGDLVMLFPKVGYNMIEVFGEKYVYTQDFNIFATLSEDIDAVNKAMVDAAQAKKEAVRIASLNKILNLDRTEGE